MSDNQETQDDSFVSADEASTSGFFIDDYSQLRLSYHRDMNDSLESREFEIAQDEVEMSNGSDNNDSVDSSDADDGVDKESEARQKLRELWISQMPDLPHPSITMASIISSASQSMGMVQLRYSDRVETVRGQENVSPKSPNRFSPQRRSTMNCKALPK